MKTILCALLLVLASCQGEVHDAPVPAPVQYCEPYNPYEHPCSREEWERYCNPGEHQG